MILDDASVLVPIDSHPVLDAMNADPHRAFYLTGSRYSATAREGSDWDFFLEDSPGAQQWLQLNGFERCGDADYEAPVDGAPHPYNVAVWERGDVNVKTVRSVEAARRTRDLVYGSPTLSNYDLACRVAVDPQARAELWTAAARLVALTMPKRALEPELVPADDGEPWPPLGDDDLPF